MTHTKHTTRLLSTLLAAAPFLALPETLAAQAPPEAGSFEIHGDYGSLFLLDGSIFSPGPGGAYQTHYVHAQGGRPWEHWTDTTYMGKHCYKVRVLPSPSTVDNDRSEQMVMKPWNIGASSPHAPTMYFTLAFYVESAPPADLKTSLIISQLWQDPRLNPFLYVSIAAGHINVQARGDVLRSDGIHKNVWTDLLDPVGNSGKSLPLEVGRWYRFMFRVTPGRGLASPGSAMVWLMDNATGLWQLKSDVTGVPMSWTTAVSRDDPRTPGQLLAAYLTGNLPFADRTKVTWKVGSYREPMPVTTRVYLDNVRFTADKWNLITKNRTIGYHRHIVHLGFDEYSGATAYDTSGDSNDGWAYANHGVILGPQRMLGFGPSGSCLWFDGVDDHVRVPIAGSTDEFDTGNYLSLSTWFSMSKAQGDKGLVTIDEYSTTYKARLYLVSHDTLQFAVRHPDNTLSYVEAKAPASLADGRWHHVAGTYNRFAAPGTRLKLYVDGTLACQAAGADKPVLRGDNYLYAGKFSGGHFRGYLDEVRMCNFELSPAQVGSQAWRGPIRLVRVR